MNVAPALSWLLWAALGLTLMSLACLTVGLSLLLSTVSHRRIALPLIWVASSVLIACVLVIVLVVTHS